MPSYDVIRTKALDIWRPREESQNTNVLVSMGSCDIHAGAQKTFDALKKEIEARGLDVDLGIVGCGGWCWAGPSVDVQRPGAPKVSYAHIREELVPDFVEDVLVGGKERADLALWAWGDRHHGDVPAMSSLEFFRIQNRVLMDRCGVIDPTNIAHYLATDGYAALDKVLGSLTQEEVIKQLLDSGLTGRGGANFPAGRKWDFLRTAAATPRYLVCNADEGDPGAFVNRIIMESDPHMLIEGMLIAAHAAGATHGFIYIRYEYPLAVERMRKAIEEAMEWGLLGQNILDRGFNCTLEVVKGAGAYVCGEETGLIQSINDYRGMPRIKPPFPAQAGVFNKPTNVNNVETYAVAPHVILKGHEWYASLGTERAKGTKIFSLSGDVSRVCIIEIPFGVTVNTVLESAGGGVPNGRALKAVQPGGPLGGFIPATLKDIPLEPQAFAEQGTLMGSGGLIFMDETRCVVDMAKRLEEFDSEESCARCTTCRVGTMRFVDIMERITSGDGLADDLNTIAHLSSLMPNANCAHGQLSPGPINVSLKFFKDEYDAHIFRKECPTKSCVKMIEYRIVPERNAEVEPYMDVCPTAAIVKDGDNVIIDQSKCIKCGLCAQLAPEGTVEVGTPRRHSDFALDPAPVGGHMIRGVSR